MMTWMAGLLLATAAPATAVPMVGGWSEVDDVAHDADAQMAATAAAARLGRRHARVERIEAASRQVVAGTNWRLRLRLADRSRWTVTMWHKLDDSWELTERRRLR